MEKKSAVLVVEDEIELNEILQEIISKIIHKVYSAKDGIEALEILNKNSDIVAIVSDICMPRMSGIELLKTLRSQFNAIPFVVLTAYGNPQTMREAVQMNATDFIDKPFKIDDFTDVIKKAIEYGESLVALEQKIEELYKDSTSENVEYLKRLKRTAMAMRIENAVYLGSKNKKSA